MNMISKVYLKAMRIVVCVLLLATLFQSCGENQNSKELSWLTIQEASEVAASKTDKKFLIDVYTDWCKWCKVMDQKTFTDPKLIAYLNDNYHVVKFNAEQKEDITFKGSTFKYVASGRGGVNSLAIQLLDGNLGYPSLVVLDEKLEPITITPGYKTPEILLAELSNLK